MGDSSVLIVEDNWILSTQVEAWLEEAGIAVAGCAGAPDEALQLADKTQPGYALVDFNLGGQLADELIDQLNARNVAVIVVTGYSSIGETRARVCDVLEKPCTKDNVVRALRMAGLEH